MKLLKFILPVLILILLGGFFYLALTDVPIQQKELTKVIPNERFFGHAAH